MLRAPRPSFEPVALPHCLAAARSPNCSSGLLQLRVLWCAVRVFSRLVSASWCPLPWVPRGRIENLRGSRRLAAPPLSHWVPAALAAAPRQGLLGPFGPRASKSVTTHFRGGQMNPHLRRAPRPRNALPMLSVCHKWPLGSPRLAPARPRNLRFVRSSRDFKASLRSAVSGLLRLSREAHKIPAYPARAP